MTNQGLKQRAASRRAQHFVLGCYFLFPMTRTFPFFLEILSHFAALQAMNVPGI
jgi:hypothetical protein